MQRRLHADQPDHFAFTAANRAWAEAQIKKYPDGRQASAVIPLLWRAQEQEGWLTRPAIEAVAEMLDMAYMRVLEVASFYFMFQLQPVGKIAHIQICGTTSCMICGAEDLVAVCQEVIAPKAHQISADGNFSWEEVECLGACANAPMAQIGKDYFEDLTADKLRGLLSDLAAGKVPQAGPQNGRFAAEPAGGITSLTEFVNAKIKLNASVQLAEDIGDSVKRIDGTEVPLLTPWIDKAANGAANSGKTPPKAAVRGKPANAQKPSAKATADKTGVTKAQAQASSKAKPPSKRNPVGEATVAPGKKPRTMKAPRKAGADDLKLIKGVGPKLETILNTLGFWHFDQIAKWGDDEVAWVDQNLEGFKGRVSRDNWVDQAKLLASGGETEFSARAKKGES
ncbi:NADH-quinone oxidoreductase subunit E [Nereida sp. MMG025]|uniref:NADH-quinone oxidoreductase subunit E n=1 Tax=Nereida sp. MMG025 TaxID=2909981 RepID=UPI001F02A5B6|nr:NADH-quinone oxidoreductase subunit E [Nereida sp. MMG025]MCF6445294.1 NADH-quinone oxidoreductase subunit E [Nereida sp. MMG025]